MVFCVWFTSLNTMPSSFLHKAACLHQRVTSFYSWTILLCMDLPHFVYPSSCWWIQSSVSTFWILGTILLQTFLYNFLHGDILSFLIVHVPRSEIARTHGNTILVIWGTDGFPKGLHYQCMRVPIFPHPQRSLLLDFLNPAILVKSVWSCTSLWFDLHFPELLTMSGMRSHTCWPFVHLWRNAYSDPLPIY